jgi:PIN domain nuclease of toxin-antitoxin system
MTISFRPVSGGMPTEPSSVLLLDTHTVLWWQAESDRLSHEARTHIEQASMRLVSPVTFWEVAMLIEKGRIELDRPTAAWVTDFLSTDRVNVAELTPTIAVAAGELISFHGDPADRMIVASAIAAGIPLVTKDDKITEWAARTRELAALW